MKTTATETRAVAELMADLARYLDPDCGHYGCWGHDPADCECPTATTYRAAMADYRAAYPTTRR